jgi:hypothetical protein
VKPRPPPPEWAVAGWATIDCGRLREPDVARRALCHAIEAQLGTVPRMTGIDLADEMRERVVPKVDAAAALDRLLARFRRRLDHATVLDPLLGRLAEAYVEHAYCARLKGRRARDRVHVAAQRRALDAYAKRLHGRGLLGPAADLEGWRAAVAPERGPRPGGLGILRAAVDAAFPRLSPDARKQLVADLKRDFLGAKSRAASATEPATASARNRSTRRVEPSTR